MIDKASSETSLGYVVLHQRPTIRQEGDQISAVALSSLPCSRSMKLPAENVL